MANHLVQLLLPVSDNKGNPFPDSVLARVKQTLIDKFGGVTAFERSPAQGVWAQGSAPQQHEDVVTIEVMVDTIDEAWWSGLRLTLERELGQQEIVARAFSIRML